MFRILTLLCLIALVVTGAYLWKSRVSTLERFLSKKLNSKVTIEQVHLGWGTLTLEGLRVENPSNRTPAFQTDLLTIEMNPLQLLSTTLQIKQIKLQNPLIGIELYNNAGSENNWAHLLNSLPTDGDSHKFIVKKLTLINLQFNITRVNGHSFSIPSIPYLEFENLGEGGALSLPQLGRVIFQSILQNLKGRANLGGLLDRVPPLPRGLHEGVTSPKSHLEIFRRKTQEASEFLRDLFSPSHH